MAKKQVSIQLNVLLLEPLQNYATANGLSLDFVIAVAIDQFLSDPDNFYTYKDGTKTPLVSKP